MTTSKNPLVLAAEQGQSLWFDFIQRSLMQSGQLKSLIDSDGISGITSNPAIFESAIANTDEYDQQIADISAADPAAAPMDIFKQLAIRDIAAAADLFAPVYQAGRGDDGMVSLEVSPDLAHDTEGTVVQARELHSALGRDNVMIKVPGTEAGVAAFEQLTAEGISVNVTLLFSVPRYREIVAAYLSGLEKRRTADKPINKIASVASFFVSRVDSAVDGQLESHTETERAQALQGKVAIANAKVAYAHYQQTFGSADFHQLQQAGALPQRLLWASTGTKNPAYSDVYYVEELIGPNTVNTLPPKTMDAFRDHGQVKNRLEQNLDAAQGTLDELADLGIDLDAITAKLEADGVSSFADAFQRLLGAIEQKRDKLAS